MISGNHLRLGRRLTGLALAGLLLAGVAGCGASNPFELISVTGKVTYEDGTPIAGDRIEVEFISQAAAIGNQHPPPGMAAVMADGTFEYVMTRNENGLVAGEHEVKVTAYDASDNPTELTVVEARITVEPGGGPLEIKVKKS